MSSQRDAKTTKLTAKILVFGFLLAAFYLFAALNAGTVMGYFSAPHWYAALGVSAVAVFLHVAFVLSVISSVRARHEMQRVEERSAIAKKRAAQRARPRPYINPWHNI